MFMRTILEHVHSPLSPNSDWCKRFLGRLGGRWALISLWEATIFQLCPHPKLQIQQNLEK
jgi:hypothetical protein